MKLSMGQSVQRYERLSAYQSLQCKGVRNPADWNVSAAATKVQCIRWNSIKYLCSTRKPTITTAIRFFANRADRIHDFAKFHRSTIDRRACRGTGRAAIDENLRSLHVRSFV